MDKLFCSAFNFQEKSFMALVPEPFGLLVLVWLQVHVRADLEK